MKTLIDDVSEPSFIFAKTFRIMCLDTSKFLEPIDTTFYDIVPSNNAVPLRRITLPVTFGTELITEFIKFKVANIDTCYNAVIGRPMLVKFMVIPHYIYMMLKLPGPNGVISIRGDLKNFYSCDTESVDFAMNFVVGASKPEVYSLAASMAKDDSEVPANEATPGED